MRKDEIVRLEGRWASLLKGPVRSSVPKIRSTKITAVELQAQLLKDEEYQKWLKEKEEVKFLLESAYRDDEKQLIEDLGNIGIYINSIWDLVNTKKKIHSSNSCFG